MSSDISKKEVAAISAAVATYLAMSQQAEKTPSISNAQKTIELLLQKVSQLEKQVEELTLAVSEVKSSVERKKK